jgi:16S rRNA G966 N2-methylase RsmD
MEKYDLVLVDPPYGATMNVQDDSSLAGLLELLGEQVTAGGIVIVRTSFGVNLLERYSQFQIAERRTWGTMAITILENSK